MALLNGQEAPGGNPSANMATSNFSGKTENEWIVDTGTTNHITHDDLHSRRLIGVGRERNGLYYLEPIKGGKALTARNTISANMWHLRLGHLPKGYRIYDLESKRIYVSRDVQFLEGIYPYTKSSLGESRQVSNEEPDAGNIPLSTDLCTDPVEEPVMESIATEPISPDIEVGCSESDESDPTVENQQAATLPSKRQRHASRNWYQKFTAALLAIGFRQSTADYSLFTFTLGGSFVAVLVYVDDVIITGTDSDHICKLKNYLDTKFHIKNLGKLKYFLGIEVARSPAGIFLSQRKYILDILAECGLTGCKPASFPMEQQHKLSNESGEICKNPKEYRRLVGRLLYLNITRPDISYAVHILSQFMHDPRQPHLDAAYRAFCDVDWAGCPMTRKSTTGYIIFLGSSPVSWRAKKQTVVSRSSAEAEYRAIATTTSEIIWLKQLLQDLKVSCTTPVSLFCDNRAAIHIAANPVFQERTKHIEIDFHFIRQHIQSQTIATKSISSQDQLADIFTKALGHDRFHQLLGKMGQYGQGDRIDLVKLVGCLPAIINLSLDGLFLKVSTAAGSSMESVVSYLEAPDCLDQTVDKLQTVDMKFMGSRAELLLIKLLLAHSPSLKKVTIEQGGVIDA
ncbi:hypothetical protein RJ639_007491 [Escallonia herrerae]|uniref:Reverse transcriptase Ty1/copia-type domain-containing protein n=1 Tax=Escallonia herrerae TaxID=1293975 RepID=A0AA89ASQ6_9ASTE|nr:hypothetical protein RJ639_007491 [Escallonia herrerae]